MYILYIYICIHSGSDLMCWRGLWTLLVVFPRSATGAGSRNFRILWFRFQPGALDLIALL